MSRATAQLLAEFERLPPDEQRQFSAVIVRRAAQLDDGDLSDEELTASASRIFAMLDEEEDAEAPLEQGVRASFGSDSRVGWASPPAGRGVPPRRTFAS